MKSDRPSSDQSGGGFTTAPLTLEGFPILHQMFRVRRNAWRQTAERRQILAEAAAAFERMASGEQGSTALFAGLGHKSDLIMLHFRGSFDELNDAELNLANLRINDFLEQTSSYLSVVELGLYEATVTLHERLGVEGVLPGSEQWRKAEETELASLRDKLTTRLFPKIPDRRYLCFYPMDKKREQGDNWYRLPIQQRQRLMHDHGMVGRRFAGKVTQIISGSIGFDDWEWGVDLFADDPMIFKKLVYEMRFDEASASYAKFGPFHLGIRLTPGELKNLLPL